MTLSVIVTLFRCTFIDSISFLMVHLSNKKCINLENNYQDSPTYKNLPMSRSTHINIKS